MNPTGFTFEDIASMMRTYKAPAWKLQSVRNGTKQNSGNYGPVSKEEAERFDLEGSIGNLKEKVDLLSKQGPAIYFIIHFGKTTADPAMQGPYDFTNTLPTGLGGTGQPPQQFPPANPYGQMMQGPSMQAFYEMIAINEAKGSVERERIQLQYNQQLLEGDKVRFEEYRKAETDRLMREKLELEEKRKDLDKKHEERMAALEKEYKDHKVRFDSESEQFKNGMMRAVKGLGDFAADQRQEQQAALSGTAEVQQEEDPRRKMVNSIALNIYNRVHVMEQVATIGIVVENLIQQQEAALKN